MSTRIFALSSESITGSITTNGNRTVNNFTGNCYVGMGITGTYIDDNTYVEATNLGSDQLTLSGNALASSGSATYTATFNKTNYNVPTNPRFTTFDTYSGTDRLFTVIYEQTPDATETFVSQGGEISNLSTTSGFEIHCYDSATNTGQRLNTIDLDTDNYYVLIYSDNHLLHHFARIKEVKNNDIDGDSFEFEPKLGNEIPKDTKLMIWKGQPVLDTARGCKILAVSAGIKSDLKNNWVCARPLFYFFNDNLDKKNELDHNTKYFMVFEEQAGTGTVTLNDTTNTFLTKEDYSKKIIDYSKFSLNVKLTDNLKDLDYPAYGETTGSDSPANTAYSLPNEYATSTTGLDAVLPVDFTDYEECFPNARRDTDAQITTAESTIEYRGPIRYTHYDYSPNKANKIDSLIDLTLEESIGTRGTYTEGKVVDSNRILGKKISNFDNLRIRHRLFRASFNDWFALKATIKTATSTSNEYTFTTQYDLDNMLNEGDEVKIGSHIYIVDNIDGINNSASSGKEQDITFRAERRAETDAIFASASYTLDEDAIIYRRAWNNTDKTLLTTFDILENRNETIYVKLISKEFGFLEATVTGSNKIQQTLTLSFPTTSQSTTHSALDYMEGSYYIEVEKFTGNIEKLSNYKKNGQTIMEFAGRSEIRKLLGPVINKNTVHSEDIIYSTSSPYNKITPITGTETNMAVNLANVGVTLTNHGLTTETDAGKHVFLKHAEHGTISYVGKIAGISTSDVFTLEDKPYSISSTASSNDYGYISDSKQIIFNKALSSNATLDSAASLNGVSGKGMYFNSGVSLTSAGAESTTLVNTTVSTANDAKAVGYYISDTRNMKSDSIFQGRIDDNAASKTYESIDTINTLIDFEVLSISEDDGVSLVEIAPYMPLTLGRVDINYGNVRDTTFNGTGLGTLSDDYASYLGLYNTILGNSSDEVLSSIASPRKYHGEPIYINGLFKGLLTEAIPNASSTAHPFYFDRVITEEIPDGSAIQSIKPSGNYGETTKLTHELNFLNGAHLHGGKIISLLDSRATDDSLSMVFNHKLYYSTPSSAVSYSEKYGPAYYRIFNLEKGNYNNYLPSMFYDAKVDGSTALTNGGTAFNKEYYAGTLSKIPYYATAYRFNPGYTLISGTSDNHIVGVGKTGLSTGGGVVYNHKLPESRGLVPVSGSRFFDTTVHKKDGTYDSVMFSQNGSQNYNYTNPYTIKNSMDLIDPKISRMFLFTTSDITPYSSRRFDSLMNSTTRDISNYSFFGLKQPIITSEGDTKEARILGVTNSLNLVDSSYSTGRILSADKTPSSLSRFSIMRLTEICFDWAFNQIDPENIPDGKTTIPEFTYTATLPVSLASYFSSLDAADYNTTNNTLQGTSSMAGIVAANDYIVDSEGRILGKVHATPLEDSNRRIKFQGTDVRKTNGTDFYTGTLFRVRPLTANRTTTVKGHGDRDSFVNFESSIHMLRSAVVEDVGSNSYGEDPSKWYSKYGEELGINADDTREPNTFLPIAVEADSILGDADNAITLTNHPSKVFAMLDALRSVQTGDPNFPSGQESTLSGYFPVFLDRFQIENADGANVTKGTVGGPIRSLAAMQFDDGSNNTTIFGVSLQQDFAQYEDIEETARTYDEDADGVMLAFKPKLYIDTTQTPDTLVASATTDVGGTIQYVYTIVVDTDITDIDYFDDDASGDTENFNKVNRTALKLMNDLTGSYLVSENNLHYKVDGSTEISSNDNKIVDCPSINDSMPTNIAYVISHEIDTSNTTETHTLILDAKLDAATNRGCHFFRIMQPNHTCFHQFTPKTIQLYNMNSKYTKLTGQNQCYSQINDYMIYNSAGPRRWGEDLDGRKNNAGGQEAIMSMYVIVDIDNQSTSDFMVVRTDGTTSNAHTSYLSSILPSETKQMYLSDGEDGHKVSVTYENNKDDLGHYLKFSMMKEMIGIVSASEPFTIKVNGDIDSDVKRGMIGSQVTICQEADDLVNQLLEDHDINFTISEADYPLFISPEFKGSDLYNSVQYILSKKNKILYYDNDSFKIKDKDDSYFSTGIFINDSTDTDLYDYDKSENMFDFYNEIIVYGFKHKSQRKDLRSIKSIGVKTLEFYDDKLKTQEECDGKSYELLKLHTSNNTKITVEIGHKQVSQLKAGDIIELEIVRENLPRNQYVVLQVEHLLTGNMRLELGRYSKGLEDRFAEIAIETKNLRAKTRDSKFNNSSVFYTSIDDIKIKPVKLIIRERASSGGRVLGFGTTLNTGNSPLGFGDSGVVHSTLLEEEY